MIKLKVNRLKQIIFLIFFFFAYSSLFLFMDCHALTSQDFTIRDPNILFYDNTYYLTGTTSWDGFIGYSSTDLVNWNSHGLIYERNSGAPWAQKLYWAAEFYHANDKFYLFFTAINDTNHRGTGVAIADSPLGPYIDLIDHPLTPPEYHCLDGHPFRDTDGKYYLFYVYEWINEGANGIGELWVQEMKSDFTELLGSPISLFKGGDAKWSNGVVDGPSMLYYSNKYFLFWSSFNQYHYGQYSVGYAYSDSILGPYTQSSEPIITTDGGHSTWFIQQDTGKLMITYHAPNAGPERVQIKELLWDDLHQKWKVNPPDNWGFLGPYPEIMIDIGIYISIAVAGALFVIIIVMRKTKWSKT